MRRTAAALALLLGPFFGGCEPSVPEGIFACVQDEDCPPALVCRELDNRCYTTREPTPDGG